MKKSALLVALALTLVLSACGEAPPVPLPSAIPTTSAAPQEQIPLEFVLPCYPAASFHPISGGNRTNLGLSGLLYEGLFQLDGRFQAQPQLCQSYTSSEDGLTWTFVLHPGATFSDGSPVTAADVVDSLTLARTSALYAPRLAAVTKVAAVEGKVVLTLSAPNGALPTLLDIPVAKAKQTVGSGPYVITGEGDTLSLTAQTAWWQGKTLPLPSIKLRSIQAADDLIYAFDTRDISLISTDLTGSNALGFSGSYETLDYPTTVMLYLGFNCKTGPCRDVALRRALTRGLDRAGVTVALLSRHAQVSALPVSPVSALYDGALAKTLEYAPLEMSALLDAAGWKESNGVRVSGRQTLSLTLLVNQDNTYRLGVADHLAEGLRSAGIEVTVSRLPWEEYLSALEKGKFDLYLGEARLTADFDLAPLLKAEGALNYGGYTDGTTTGLLTAFQTAGGDARVPAAQALYTNLAEQAPFAPLCFKNWSVLTQWGQLEGLTPTQQNVFYGFADWKLG